MAIPLMAILGGMLAGGGIAGMFPPLSRWGQYGMNRLWPNEITGASEAIELYYRGKIDRVQLNYELESTGLNTQRQDWLVDLRHQLFNAVEAIILWRRNEIEESELNSRLLAVGIPEADIPLWVKFTETRPSVQDIITFAVREVYTPDIAEKYGLFEGYEEVAGTAAPDLKAAGVLPDTLRKFWGAHWVLPSAQMGFEMLHRGVITLEDMQTLLRTQDIMPFWRDKITEISYNVLTRVDVRRMHKMGVINDAELVKAYKDIGYNDENAQRMADFTIAYNFNPESSEETTTDRERQQWKDLTKSDVVNGYIDGLFTEVETREALSNLAYADNEIDFLLSRADYKNEQEGVNKIISAYHTAYIGNMMSYNEIIDKLGQLNLTGKRVENLFNIWDIEKSIRVNKPTKAEILSFVRKGIIDKVRATTELLGMNYTQEYVDWYLQTV